MTQENKQHRIMNTFIVPESVERQRSDETHEEYHERIVRTLDVNVNILEGSTDDSPRIMVVSTPTPYADINEVNPEMGAHLGLHLAKTNPEMFGYLEAQANAALNYFAAQKENAKMNDQEQDDSAGIILPNDGKIIV